MSISSSPYPIRSARNSITVASMRSFSVGGSSLELFAVSISSSISSRSAKIFSAISLPKMLPKSFLSSIMRSRSGIMMPFASIMILEIDESKMFNAAKITYALRIFSSSKRHAMSVASSNAFLVLPSTLAVRHSYIFNHLLYINNRFLIFYVKIIYCDSEKVKKKEEI